MAKRSDVEWKLAQMFMVGFQGVDLNEPTKEFIQEYQPGSIIYFKCNYETPSLMGELSQSIQDLKQNPDKLPFFISVDHEGGKVHRFTKPFTHFPEPYVLGEIDSPKLAFSVADVMAKELRAVGINLDFFPLCDIHTKVNNPVIAKRAFGKDPELVSRIASAVVRGFVKNNMVTSVKHYPGHGDTTVDSHFELPKISYSWDELKVRELIPFEKAIRSRVDMIMTAHILNEQLDPIYPASLSLSTLKYLREEMRFTKVIISDDMQMEAITKNFGAEDAVALAINAGSDMLIYRDLDKGRAAMDTAFKFLAEGRIEEERVQESYERIKEVKQRTVCKMPPVDIEKISSIVGCEEHQEVLQQLQL